MSRRNLPAAAPLLVIREPASVERTPAPERTTTVLGRTVAYSLRVSQRAKRLRLVIHPPGRLEVVVPRRTSQARIDAALRDKAAWILATLERVASAAHAAEPAAIAAGDCLPCAGRTLTLAIKLGAPAGRFRAQLDGGTLTLTLADASQPTLRAALRTWCRGQARQVFAERLDHYNAVYGFAFGRVSIKEQKSRWGSCSRAGNLNFNWRLLLAPLPVLDYVVVHELCHLRELNHSPAFWALVARACPDYLIHRRWLRQHGRSLRF
jgi:predicted metal-dependent hydrolase